MEQEDKTISMIRHFLIDCGQSWSGDIIPGGGDIVYYVRILQPPLGHITHMFHYSLHRHGIITE